MTPEARREFKREFLRNVFYAATKLVLLLVLETPSDRVEDEEELKKVFSHRSCWPLFAIPIAGSWRFTSP
jgi:hypothetical protein